MLKDLNSIIDKIKEKISEQGPLEYFVHHNTIHHYQHLEFTEAVRLAAKDYNARAFMPESYYAKELKHQRISMDALKKSCTYHIEKYQLKFPSDLLYKLLTDDPETHHLSDKAIKTLQEKHAESQWEFYYDYYREHFNIDISYAPHSHILRFCAAYFDFGSAYWSLYQRNDGVWKVFCNIYSQASFFNNKFLKALSKTIQSFDHSNSINALETILNKLNIKEEYVSQYLFSLCYRYKGWFGFIKSLEEHPEWVKVKVIKPSFSELLAIVALCEYANIISLKLTLPEVPTFKPKYRHSYKFISSYIVYYDKFFEYADALQEGLPFLSDMHREEIWHRAFENSFYKQCLDVYKTNLEKDSRNSPSADYQIVCCIDEREESFRRYLEIDPHCETFGFAGHFGLNIRFKGYFDKHLRSLCPIDTKPEFTIEEVAIDKKHLKFHSILIWGELQWISALSSKRLLRGIMQTFFGFITQVIPLALDIISPRITYRIKKHFSQYINHAVKTELLYKKEDNKNGFSFEDRVRVAKNLLLTTGLSNYFAPFIFIMGHGSSSLNNPHEAAHDCGACGGGRGGPNARIMAAILNEKAVRVQLKNLHINIPEHCQFIGGYHNTSSDDVIYYDLPDAAIENLSEAIKKIELAAHLSAKERCRRFTIIPNGKSPKYYARKMQDRSIDLRQPRPEYGHATNAICIIGPRSLTRNLFLDRRAFLVSYQPEFDIDGTIINAIANTAVPVCSGINLEYYFSFIDNEIYGCGTKLPHNVTSLIGVMNGYQSDLQLGLPWQMVEIHQPIRLLTIIYADLSTIKNLLTQSSQFTELVTNHWITLVIHNVEDDLVYLYQDQEFILYETHQIVSRYYRVDKRIFDTLHHLEFGRII